FVELREHVSSSIKSRHLAVAFNPVHLLELLLAIHCRLRQCSRHRIEELSRAHDLHGGFFRLRHLPKVHDFEDVRKCRRLAGDRLGRRFSRLKCHWGWGARSVRLWARLLQWGGSSRIIRLAPRLWWTFRCGHVSCFGGLYGLTPVTLIATAGHQEKTQG